MNKSIYYFARVNSERMNEFENFLTQRDIEYNCVSHFFFQKDLSMVYGFNVDSETLSLLRLTFPQTEVNLSYIAEHD